MSFISNLIIFGLSLLGIFILLLYGLFRNYFQRRTFRNLSVIVSEHYGIFTFIQIVLLVAFVTVLILSFLSDQRPGYYFIIEALLFANGTFIAFSKGSSSRGHLLILTISIVSLSNFAAIYGRSWQLPMFQDQYRDVFVANSIVAGSKFSDTQLLMDYFNGYYALIPAVPILTSSLSVVTGVPTYLTIPILDMTVSYVSQIGVFLAFRRFGNDLMMGWVAAFIVLSTPRLVYTGAIPQQVSMTVITIAFLIFFIRLNSTRLEKSDLKYTGIIIFLVIGATLYHPSGAITILFLLVPIMILMRFIVTRQLRSKLGLLTAIIAVSSIAYWSYNDLALSSLTSTNEQFFQSFFNAYNRNSHEPPNLEQGGCELCAFSWALPYAISAAFLVVQGLFFIRSRKIGLKGQRTEWQNKFFMAVAAALVATAVTFVGFLSFSADPSASIERYISLTTFFLMLIPASISAGWILNSLRTPYFFVMLIILSISVAIGSNSPDAAPVEHRSSQVGFALYATYLEVLPLKQYVPAQSLMYIDNDVPEFWYLDRHKLDIHEPTSYQTTREVLRNLANGTLDYFPNDKGDVTIFIIKTDRLLNATASLKDVNLIQSTGIHKVFLIEKEPPQSSIDDLK
jgi:hypothetical protein